jgi:hypothetical protein
MWSKGHVEGHVDRLKAIGRARFGGACDTKLRMYLL